MTERGSSSNLVVPAAGQVPGPGLRRVVTTLTGPPWLTVLAFGNALGCLIVAAAYLTSLDGVLDAEGNVITGDFLNFYVGGRMIVQSDGASLYDIQAQQDVRREITGPDYHKVHWYNYPPTWAIVLAPAAALPYVGAFYVYDLAMLAAMLATLWMLAPLLPALRRHWLTTVMLVVCFHPIIRNIVGGQNTVLTLCLVSGAYAGLRTNRAGLAGLFLGLLLYKPQFAVPLLLLTLIRGERRAFLVAGCVGVGHYLVGAAFCGLDWPWTMWQFLGSFREMEIRLNAATHISLLSACDYALVRPWNRVIAGALMTAVTAVLLRFARRSPTDGSAFDLFWALAVTGTLLLSPHTQYYDAGVLVLPVVLGLNHMLQKGRTPSVGCRLALLAGYLAYPIYEASPSLGFQPLLLWPVLIFAWLGDLLIEQARDVRPASPGAATFAAVGDRL